MEEDSDKATALKKAYAEMILNIAKESAARVMVSERNSARFHHDLCVTKDEAVRLLVRLKQMIDAKTIEAEIISSNKQREIDLLEAQLQEAEDIITDLRSELRWVRDKLEKARVNVVNKEQEESILAYPEVSVASLHPPNQEVSVMMSDSLPNQSSLRDGDDEKQFDGLSNGFDACESELDADIRNKKLELSGNGCTQRTCLHPPDQEVANTCFSVTMSDSLPNQSSLCDDECGVEDEKQFDGLSNGFDACESELDADIRNKKLELSRNGCTQRIHALERKSSPCINEEERRKTEKAGEENLSSVNTRCLVLALRARNAEVITTKPLGIKKSRKLQGRRKRRWSGKRKATAVRSQSQLIKPCQSQFDILCSKTSVENSDDKGSIDTHLSVENEEVDDLNACKGLEEHLQHCADGIGIIRRKKRSKNVENSGGMSSAVNPTDHLFSVNVENGTKIKPLPRLDLGLTSANSNVDLTLGSTNATVVSVNATNRSTDKDLKSRKDDSMVPSTKMGCTDLKATAVVSDRISESPRAGGNRLVKYTFERRRKRDLYTKNNDDNNSSREGRGRRRERKQSTRTN